MAINERTRPIYTLRRFALASTLVSILPACSSNVFGDNGAERNAAQVVDGPRRVPLLNPKSTLVQSAQPQAPVMYQGFVPPSYAAEPVRSDPVVALKQSEAIRQQNKEVLAVPLEQPLPRTPEPSTWDSILNTLGLGEESAAKPTQTQQMRVEPMAFEVNKAETQESEHAQRKPLPSNPAHRPALIQAPVTTELLPEIAPLAPKQIQAPIAALSEAQAVAFVLPEPVSLTPLSQSEPVYSTPVPVAAPAVMPHTRLVEAAPTIAPMPKPIEVAAPTPIPLAVAEPQDLTAPPERLLASISSEDRQLPHTGSTVRLEPMALSDEKVHEDIQRGNGRKPISHPLLATREGTRALQAIPETPAALPAIKSAAPAAKQELENDAQTLKNQETDLRNAVEEDRPNSLQEELLRTQPVEPSPPPPQPLPPRVYLAPPAPPENLQAYLLPASSTVRAGASPQPLVNGGAADKNQPTIAANGVMQEQWYLPASAMGVSYSVALVVM